MRMCITANFGQKERANLHQVWKMTTLEFGMLDPHHILSTRNYLARSVQCVCICISIRILCTYNTLYLCYHLPHAHMHCKIILEEDHRHVPLNVAICCLAYRVNYVKTRIDDWCRKLILMDLKSIFCKNPER